MHFRYDKKWVSSEIINNNLENFKNKEALIIILDSHKENGESFPLFFPVRKVKIKNISSHGNVVNFYFELLPHWTDYRTDGKLKDYQKCINSLTEKPSFSKENLIGKFVSYETIKDDLAFSKDMGAWESIIDKIGSLDSYSKVLFCLVMKFQEIISKKNIGIKNFSDFNSGYEIISDKDYKLQIYLRFGDEPPDLTKKDKFIIKTGKSFYRPIPEEIQLGFRFDIQEIFLSTKQLLSDTQTKLTINLENGDIHSPTIGIPIRVKSNQLYILKMILAYICGITLTSGIFPIGGILGSLVKVGGLGLSTYVIFKLFKKF